MEVQAYDCSNLDEVGFDQGIDGLYVIARKGVKQNRQVSTETFTLTLTLTYSYSHSQVSAERAEHLTMVAMISPGGSGEDNQQATFCTPFAILKAKVDKHPGKPESEEARLPKCPLEMRHGVTENGYVTDKLWDEQIADWIIAEVPS